MSAAHVCRAMGPSSGVWETHRWPDHHLVPVSCRQSQQLWVRECGNKIKSKQQRLTARVPIPRLPILSASSSQTLLKPWWNGRWFRCPIPTWAERSVSYSACHCCPLKRQLLTLSFNFFFFFLIWWCWSSKPRSSRTSALPLSYVPGPIYFKWKILSLKQ